MRSIDGYRDWADRSNSHFEVCLVSVGQIKSTLVSLANAGTAEVTGVMVGRVIWVGLGVVIRVAGLRVNTAVVLDVGKSVVGKPSVATVVSIPGKSKNFLNPKCDQIQEHPFSNYAKRGKAGFSFHFFALTEKQSN